MLERVHELDEAVDKWLEPRRTAALDRVFYGLSSAADHGMLWHAAGVLRRVPAPRTKVRGPVQRHARRRVGDHEPCREVTLPSRAPAGALRPRRAAPVRHAAADHVVVPVGPRGDGVHVPRRCSRRGIGAAPSGSRSQDSSRRAASTCECTMPPTWSPVQRSASHSAASPAAPSTDTEFEP